MSISSGNNPSQSSRMHNMESSTNFVSNAERFSERPDRLGSRSAADKKTQGIGAQYFDRSRSTHHVYPQNFSTKHNQYHTPNPHAESKNHQEIINVTKEITKLVERRDLVSAFNLIESTQSDNLTPRTFQPLFKELEVQCDFDNAQNLFKLMKSKKISPDVITYRSMIVCACKVEDVLYGETLLKEMKKESISCNRFHYEPLVKRYLYNKKSVENALRLVEEMIKEGVMPETRVFNGIMNAYVQKEDLAGAQRIWKMMEENKISPDVITYSTLMNAYAQKGGSKEAERLFNRMETSGISPNIATYATLMNAYAQKGDSKEAERVFNRMEASGVSPNIAAYNTLMNAYAQKGDPEGAHRVLTRMKQKKISPDIATYTTLMNAYAQKGNSEEAQQVFNRMEASGVSPNIATYTTLMNAYTQKGNSEEAQRVFNRMEASGISPNIAAYTTLMNAYAQKGDLEGVERVFRIVKKKRLSLDLTAYTTLMNTYAQKLNPEGAERIWIRMKEDNVSPDVAAYNTLMNAYAQKGDSEGFERVLDMMKKAGVAPNINTYAILMNGYILANNLPEARQIYEELKKQMNTIPIEAYLTLINGYSKAKDYSSVLCIFEEQKFESFSLSHGTYTQVFEAYGKMHKAQQAQALLSWLQAKNSKVIDVIHYNCVMNAFADIGDVEQVKALCEEAQKNGFAFDSSTISTILKAYVRAEEPKEGLIFIREHESCKNVPFQPLLYSQLISIHTKMRRPDGADYWLSKMCAANITPSKSILFSIVRSYSQLGNFKGVKRIVKYAKRYGYNFNEKDFTSCCEVQTKDVSKTEEISSVPISPLKLDVAVVQDIASAEKVELPKVLLSLGPVPVDPDPVLIPQVLLPQVTLTKESSLAYKFVQNKNNYVGVVAEDHQLKETSQQFHVTPCSKTFVDSRFSDQFQKAHEKFLEKKLTLDPDYEAALQRPDKDKIKPDFVDIKKIDDRVGFGAFANKEIKQGTIIGEYIGKIVTWEHLDKEDPDCSYSFECEGNGEDAYQAFAIDGCETGNFTRFFNHGTCKNRNLRAVHYFNESGPHIIFETTRKIRAGEELRFNYGKKYWTIKEIDPVQS